MKKVITVLLCAVMLIGFAIAVNAEVGTVVYANRTEKAPNLEEVDDSWGEPSIILNKNSANTQLYDYLNETNPRLINAETGKHESSWNDYKDKGIKAEDHDVELYYLWDDKYLYFGMKTLDDVYCGWANPWEGDGVQMWLMPMDAIDMMNGYVQNVNEGSQNPNYKPYAGIYDFYWTLDTDDYTCGNASTPMYPNAAADCECHINTDIEGELHCTIAIPLSSLGLNPKKGDIAGSELATAVLRVSSTQIFGAHAYAGWLSWGRYFYDGTCTSFNTIRFANGTTPPATEDTTPDTQDTTAEITPKLDGVSSWAKDEVEKGILAGLVPEYLQTNYTSPVTRGAVAEVFIRLVEKITGKTAEQLIAEKGYTIDEGKFTDTNDRNVILANALGIINGTSATKFSPDGTLKRAQIAALINRVARVCGVETEGYTHDFVDITDNYAWVDKELGWPVHAGVINGVGQGKFNPGGDLTTEQAILITYRAFEAIKK